MEEIHFLKEKYKQFSGMDVKHIYHSYIKQREATLMDSITAAAAVNAVFVSDSFDYSQITPQMEEAFQLSFPNKDLSELSNYTTEELTGVISNWKGKVFELDVRDKLNNGELVGDIQLVEGQYAEIAAFTNQPGWDLQIFNADGTVAEALQLKATDSLGYINDALEKYPHIDIMSTSEIAELNSNLINGGISNADLEESIREPLVNLFDSPLGDVMENIFPFLPVVVITLAEGRNVMVGKQTLNQGIKNGAERGAKTAAAFAVGGVFAWLDGGVFTIAAPMAVRWGLDSYTSNRDAVKIIKPYNQTLLELT